MWSWEVDLVVGARSRRGRYMCKPVQRWVNPACGSATGEERKDMEGCLVALKMTVCGMVES